jgi:predicted TIM-barrel fold metal-dependent hydrolase
LTQPIVDCHCHILDPRRFLYGADNPYYPEGVEINTTPQFTQLLAAHHVTHALLVQPNSGYGPDNAALLDAIEQGGGRFKGVAIIPHDISLDDLARLKARGIVGAAVNPTFDGIDHYRDITPLLPKLAELDMFLQLQVEGDMLTEFLPLVAGFTGKILIDHCGRPVPKHGLNQPGFRALLALGRTGRANIKLSGHVKFSDESYPYADTWPFVRALVDAFTLDHCMWGSDWPCLRARERVDYGRVLALT